MPPRPIGRFLLCMLEKIIYLPVNIKLKVLYTFITIVDSEVFFDYNIRKLSVGTQ